MKILYVTTNEGKIRVVNKYLNSHGIQVVSYPHNLLEIQSESIEEITRHKAKQAFAEIKQPLLVNDAGWSFIALNGFPGAYMRYVNEWLTPDDFIRLMRAHENREVIYTEYFCYIDHKQHKIFSQEVRGKFLDDARGKGPSSWSLISLRKDGLSIAEAWEKDIDPVDEYTVWTEIAEFLGSL